MKFTIESEQEEDGRWLAEVLELPGVMVYGQTKQEALAKAQALALRALAERLEHGEMLAEPINILFAAA
jgi:predicted RNase H-like HicB family nuclease